MEHPRHEEPPAAPTPVLAGCVGQYRETAPLPPLRPHFRCIWSHAIPADRIGPIAVVPDGCVDLLWHDCRLAVVGPDLTAATPTLRPGTTVLGLRFQPGAAATWLGLPMSEIVGCEVALADFWGRRAHEFSANLDEVAAIGAQADVLQHLLSSVMPSIGVPDREAAAIFEVMKNAGVVGPKMSRILDRLDVSERTLRRRSRDHFGYGPKTLDRILRFQRFLAMAQGSPGSGLAGLAFEAGYADQAHLSREIQALCGMTAATLVRQIAA